MDTVNELGKDLKKTKDRANRALKKASPEYGMAERARDIFDPIVPYTMSFRVPRKGMQVRANMQFEYPPPNGGSGGCCGDCYCAVCERFLVSEITGTSILLNRPYEPGSIRVFNGEIWITVGVNESDPDAGIVYIDSCFGSDSVTICYVYKYDNNCSYKNEYQDYLYPCGITDTFTRTVTDGWGTSDAGYVWTKGFAESNIYVDGSSAVFVSSSETASAHDGRLTTGIIPSYDGEVISGSWDFWSEAIASDLGPIAQIMFGGRAIFGAKMGTSGVIRLQWNVTLVEVQKRDWVAQTWYRMRFLYDKGSAIMALKVWPRDEAEPEEWGITRDPSGDSGVGISDYVLITLSRSAASPDPMMMRVDNLDIIGVDKCSTLCITDTFTRTVSGNWGTSDAGIAWLTGTYSTPATISVTGTVGKIVCNEEFISGGWASLEATSSNIQVKLKITQAVADLGQHVSIKFGNSVTESGDIWLMGNGEIWDDTSQWTPSVSFGSWFYIQAEVSGTSYRYRLWQEGGIAPETWQTLPANSTTTSFFDIEIRGNGLGQYDLEIDNLDVTGVNMCSLVILDDFNRVITGNIIDNTFGYSTNPVAQWYASGPEWSCDGNYLLLDAEGAGEDYGAWLNIPYDRVSTTPPMPWQDDQFLMEFRFKYVATVYIDDDVYFQVQFARSGSPPNNPVDFFYFTMDTNTVDGEPLGYIAYKYWNGTVYSTSVYHWMVWTPDSWYKCRIEKTANSTIRMKVWLETDAEPAWQITGTSSDWNVRSLDINGFGLTYPSNYGKLWIDYIAFGPPTE